MSRWSIVRSRFIDFLFRVEVVKRRGYRFVVLACSIGFRSAQRSRFVSMTDWSSIWNAIDKLQLRNTMWNKFEEVFTVLYAMVYLGKPTRRKRWMVGRESAARRNLSQSIRDRIERGPSRFRCTPTSPKFSRRRDDGSTLSFTFRKFGAFTRRIDDNWIRWAEKLFSFIDRKEALTLSKLYKYTTLLRVIRTLKSMYVNCIHSNGILVWLINWSFVDWIYY